MLLVLLLSGLLIAVVATRDDLGAAFDGLRQQAIEWQAQSPAAVAVGGVVCVCVWIVVLIPSTPIELLLGYLFGLGGGFVLVYIGKVCGCLASFWLGRTVLFECTQRQLRRHRLLLAADVAVQKEPLRICLLARAAYIPIALKNYGFAVLSVPARPFVVALLLVESYNSFELVFLGAAASSFGSHASWLHALPLVVACASLVALGLYGGVMTKRALSDLESEGSEGGNLRDAMGDVDHLEHGEHGATAAYGALDVRSGSAAAERPYVACS